MSVNFATLNSSEKVPLIRIHLHLIDTEKKKKDQGKITKVTPAVTE